MKKLLLAMCLGAAALGASGANYLHIKTANGWEVLDLDKVDRLTFSGGVMTAQNDKGATVGTYSQTSLEQIVVNDVAGLGHIIGGEATAATFSMEGMTARMLADGPFEVYGTDGTLLVSIPAKSGEQISLEGLREAGIVIVKSGNYAIKAAVR